MMIQNGKMLIMFWPTTRQNCASGHQGCVVKATPARNTTTRKTEEEILKNINTGTWSLRSSAYVFLASPFFFYEWLC